MARSLSWPSNDAEDKDLCIWNMYLFVLFRRNDAELRYLRLIENICALKGYSKGH